MAACIEVFTALKRFDFLLLLGAKLRSQPPDRAVFSACAQYNDPDK
jgi:hypothetical protein